jgi:hypothetical protein
MHGILTETRDTYFSADDVGVPVAQADGSGWTIAMVDEVPVHSYNCLEVYVRWV